MIFVEAEELAAILEPEAETGRAQTASHTAEVALDERDHGAVAIGSGEIDRVSGSQHRLAGLELE